MTPLRMERFSLHKDSRTEAQTLCQIMNRELGEGSPEIVLDEQNRLQWL